MNRLVMLFLLLISTRAFADSDLTRADFSQKIKFQTDTFVTSTDGKILKEIVGAWTESNLLKDKERALISSVVFQPENAKSLLAEVSIEVKPNLEMQINFEQWDKVIYTKEQGPKFSNSLRKLSQPIVNFGSVQFVIPQSATTQYVVRVTPVINRKPAPAQLNYLPMSVTDLVAIDNQGKVWAQSSSASGEVVCISGRYGSVYMSFAPFAGSKPIGSARDSEIDLEIDQSHRLYIHSAKAVIGAGYAAIVHARIETSQKQPHGSISEMSGTNVEKYIKDFSKR